MATLNSLRDFQSSLFELQSYYALPSKGGTQISKGTWKIFRAGGNQKGDENFSKWNEEKPKYEAEVRDKNIKMGSFSDKLA